MSFDINELIGNLGLDEGIEKQASEVKEDAKPSVADELREALLTKSASEVAAEAEDLGRQLARRLMEKAASQVKPEVVEGDALSTMEVSLTQTFEKEAEAQGHIANADNAAMAAEQGQVDAHALQSGGTVESQTAETIQKGLATPSATATSEDMVRKIEDQGEDANMQKAAAVMALVEEGLDFYNAADLVAVADSELQKEAALAELVNEGYDFDDAVSLIKAASETPKVSDEVLEKVAAFQELTAEGYSFDEATDLIKEAGIGLKIRQGINQAKIEGRKLSTSFDKYKKEKAKDPAKGKAYAKKALGKAFDRNKGVIKGVGIGVGTVAAAGTGAVAVNKAMKKEAAFKDLLAQGYSFDEAAEAVRD